MSWFSTVVTAFITAAAGTVLSGYVAVLAIRWYNISGFEGKSGYYMISMALLGLIVGAVVGVIASRVVAASANPSLLKALGISLMTMSSLVAVVGVVGRLKADVPPTMYGEELMVIVEARWPATQLESPASVPGVSYVELGSVSSGVERASRRGPLWKEDAHRVDGRWVVPGAVFLFTERGDRSITFALDDSSRTGFLTRLPRRPGKSDLEWSEWYPKDGRRGPTIEDGVTFRYRVQKESAPIRTEHIGRFTVAAIASGFQHDIPEGTTTLDGYAKFEIQHGGKPVRFTAGGEPVERVGMIALLPSAEAALLAYVEGDSTDSYCALLVDQGSSVREEKVDACSNGLQVETLTSDNASFAAMKSVNQPRGRVDRRTFAESALLLFRKAVLNTHTLEVHRISEISASSYIPSVPPLGVSPDGSSFVRYYYGPNGEAEPLLKVTNFIRDEQYDLPIDPVRMRYAEFNELTPEWLLHHFRWEPGQAGSEVLKVRPDFIPIPYFGTIIELPDGSQDYRIPKGGQDIRLALIEHLQKEFGATREPVEDDAYEYPVTVEGKHLRIASTGGNEYVLVSQAHGDAPSDIVARIGKSFNTALATGRYDALFVN